MPYSDATQSGPALIAMNYGQPIIASDLPAFKQIIIDGKNGFLFKNGDSDSLKQVIERAVKLSQDEVDLMKSAQLQFKESYLADIQPNTMFNQFIQSTIKR